MKLLLYVLFFYIRLYRRSKRLRKSHSINVTENFSIDLKKVFAVVLIVFHFEARTHQKLSHVPQIPVERERKLNLADHLMRSGALYLASTNVYTFYVLLKLLVDILHIRRKVFWDTSSDERLTASWPQSFLRAFELDYKA